MPKVDSKNHSNPIEKSILSAIDNVYKGGRILHICYSGAAAIYEGVKYVVKEAKSIRFIDSLKYLRSIDLLYAMPNLYKNLKKCCTQEKKLWPALKVIHDSFIISITISDIISLAMIVSNVVSKTFAAIAMGSTAFQLLRDGKKMKKYQLHLKNFTEKVGYDESGNYKFENYTRLIRYINEVGIKALAKQFDVDKDSFKKTLSLKLNKISPLHGQFQKDKLREIMDLFKTRLEHRKRACIVSLVTDGVNLLGGALLVVPGAATFLIPFLTSFNATVGSIQFVANKINLYKFENQMGMNNSQYQPGVKDFFKWCFNHR